MSNFLVSLLITLLLFGLLISGISCSHTVIILPPAHTPTPTQSAIPTRTATPTQIATPTQMSTPIPTPLSSLDVDLHNVQTAVGSYAIQCNKWPTASGSLPATGQYALIDFNASFFKDGKIMSFYPHFVTKLPRHWDQGVWRIDSAARVSLDMNQDEY